MPKIDTKKYNLIRNKLLLLRNHFLNLRLVERNFVSSPGCNSQVAGSCGASIACLSGMRIRLALLLQYDEIEKRHQDSVVEERLQVVHIFFFPSAQ